MKTTKWRATLVATSWLVGGTVAWQCGGAGSDSYDKCKAAGGDTESGNCALPGFQCDGEEGNVASYHKVWYICQGDPPVWVKENPQPK